MPITHHGKVIDDAQRQKIAAEIKARRDTWTHFSEYPFRLPKQALVDLPNFFLGSPIYMTGKARYLYEQLRPRGNQLLETAPFVELLKIAESNLAQHYGKPVEHMPGTSLPGFHVFNSVGKSKSSNHGHFHFDHDIKILNPDIDVSKIYSFVVFIEVTAAGDYLEYSEKPGGQIHRLDYEPGYMYSWSGNMWHRLGDVTLPNDSDYRISLQGHFIMDDDKIQYYW